MNRLHNLESKHITIHICNFQVLESKINFPFSPICGNPVWRTCSLLALPCKVLTEKQPRVSYMASATISEHWAISYRSATWKCRCPEPLWNQIWSTWHSSSWVCMFVLFKKQCVNLFKLECIYQPLKVSVARWKFGQCLFDTHSLIRHLNLKLQF